MGVNFLTFLNKKIEKMSKQLESGDTENSKRSDIEKEIKETMASIFDQDLSDIDFEQLASGLNSALHGTEDDFESEYGNMFLDALEDAYKDYDPEEGFDEEGLSNSKDSILNFVLSELMNLTGLEDLAKMGNDGLDDEITAEDIQEYLKNLKEADGDSETLSFEDINKTITDQNIDLAHEYYSNFLKDYNEKVKENNETNAASASGGGSGGGGGVSGGGSSSDSTNNNNNNTNTVDYSKMTDEQLQTEKDKETEAMKAGSSAYLEALQDRQAYADAQSAFIAALKDEGSEVSIQLAEAIEQENQTEKEVFETEGEIQKNAVAIEENEQNTAQTKEEIATSQENIENLGNQITNLDSQISSLQAQISSLESNSQENDADAQIAALSGQISALTAQKAEIEAQKQEEEANLENLKQQEKALEEEKQTLEEEKQTLEDKSKELQEKCMEESAAISIIIQEYQVTSQEIIDAQKAYVEAQSAYMKKINEAQQAFNSAKANLEQIKSAMNSNQDEKEAEPVQS